MKIETLTDVPAIRKYLSRIGAEPRSFRTAVIKLKAGRYWKDLAVIRFTKEGEVTVSDEAYAPTEPEATAIKDECRDVQWPAIKPLHQVIHPPEMLRKADVHDIFEFRNERGEIMMVQVRVVIDGERNYIPWTYWDDDKWRMCEPDGPLPLYNLDRIKDAGAVFIHEGAKAARYVQWMVDSETAEARRALAAHPWGQEFTGAVHLGWIGGAMSPYRTDWSKIMEMGVKRAYIIADNDQPGISAVPSIARQLRLVTFAIQFTDEFPKSFDLADPFPKAMFGRPEGVRHYVGPSFRDCLHPATWATDLRPNPKGKPSPVLRDAFATMWAYVEELDQFVCTEMPEIVRPEAILNKMLAGFSHVAETSRLIVQAYHGRHTRVCYRPDHDGLLVTYRGSSAINLHIPCQIRPGSGSAQPWLDFLAYLFVNDGERKEVERWCATLIARPDIRMSYGLLLVSERQGTGKTTLGSAILAPLVGMQNVGYPKESDIATSDFNGWMAAKRLIVVNEIYSGSSWKAYNSLKSVITDTKVDVNEKYVRPYTIDNWCHVVAASNSMRALKMENDDRRWFYPEVTEVPWSRERFREFRRWLDSGGLSIIKQWAIDHGDYVAQADRAPMTDRKQELIEGSRSDAQKEAAALAGAMAEVDRPAALAMKDIVAWARNAAQGRVFDSDWELRKAMSESGTRTWSERVKINGSLQYVIVNDRLWDLLSRSPKDKQPGLIREHMTKPVALQEGSM